MNLNERQQRFVEAMLSSEEPTHVQAYIAAGYSERNAKKNAHKLACRPEIVAALAAARAERAERTQINADWLLMRLAEEAVADIADLYNDDGSLKPVRQWPKVWRTGLVAGVDIEEMFEGRGEHRQHVGRVRKLKLADRTRLLELIGKHVNVQAFKDRIEHSGVVATADITQSMTAKEAAELYRAELG